MIKLINGLVVNNAVAEPILEPGHINRVGEFVLEAGEEGYRQGLGDVVQVKCRNLSTMIMLHIVHSIAIIVHFELSTGNNLTVVKQRFYGSGAVRQRVLEVGRVIIFIL